MDANRRRWCLHSGRWLRCNMLFQGAVCADGRWAGAAGAWAQENGGMTSSLYGHLSWRDVCDQRPCIEPNTLTQQSTPRSGWRRSRP